MKHKKLKIIILVILILLIFFITEVDVRHHAMDAKIDSFIDRAVYEETIDETAYYKVNKEYEYEDNKNIGNPQEVNYIGTTGDIYLVNSDPVGMLITNWLSRRLYLGHCGIVYNEDASQMVEVVGNKSREENVVKVYNNDWMLITTNGLVVLRVKGIDDDKKNSLIDYLDNQMGKKYNYFFLAHLKNSFYCMDIASRAYEEIGIDIDGNLNITLGSSLIDSDNTYLIYYRMMVHEEGMKYKVYYLSED